MSLNNIKPFHVSLTPVFKTHPDGVLESAYKWGILNNPRYVNKTEEGVLLAFLNEDAKEITNGNSLHIQMMRLFACNTIRDLLLNQGTVDQNITHEIKFDLPQEIKEYVAKVVGALGQEIIKEIIYQNDPLKPTKSKLESLSLTPKQTEE
jgi:hypothetical protein